QLTADCGAGLKPNTIIEKATLDFDGIDDYVQTDEFIKGQSEVTIMAWVKADVANAGKPVTIAGEDITCRLYLGNGTPIFGIRTTSSASGVNVSGSPIAYDEWHHIAGSFSGTTGKMNLYIDGKLVKSTNSGLSGTITSTALSEGKFEIGRVSRAVADRQYFKGDIDEVRVFDQVLTTDQIQRMVYQEIQESTGNVRGSVIGKDVVDITSNTKVLWNNLVAYYPMTDIISYERTTDYSMYERFTTLHNITTFLEQTAPMPYETKQSGNWTTEATWLHGDVWDIEAVASNKDWSIVRVNSGDALATGNSHTNIGTIIEDGGSLTITGDKALTNSWYFELNGSIDLQGDSQLIQGEYSDLVTSANGKLLRRQDSNDNVYRYTYVSSPVGSQSATTLGNDNGNTNNANNTSFSLSMLKKGDGTPVQFTSAYNENGKMSTRWTYTFINGITYYDWASLDPATAINPGEGYIHKGMGNGGATQEFLYEGRPNNGTILIAADDVDGDSGNESQPDVTQTTTLIGNPYPSAIDAHKFIDDNAAVIDGTLYLWQHWGGDSHILNEYEGGYATINKMTKIRAYQFVGKSGADNGSMDGTITPKQYIAPGQSFMAEVIADGNIEFNNAQRVYKRESVGETAFFRTSENDKATATERTTENDSTELKVLGLEFRMSNDLTREFVLGFSPETTMDFDYGYDAKMMAVKSDDMYTMWTDQKMIAQAYPEITTETEIPLHMVTTGAHTYELSATELTGFEDLDVYLWDKYNDTYFDLAAGGYYAFTSEAGEYTDRFAIVFETTDTLSEEEVMLEDTLIYYNTKLDKLFVRGLKENSKRISLTDMSGKTIQQFSDLSTSQLEDGLRITNISSGIYMASVVTDTNRIINKKIIID
ncbi:MAG: T9SS type A sorting domain-containing protein, partial [Bacteroidia bacterium]|nr:T9SS type A sorting domain-containing protein [Bacteroidia bacterium]